LTLNEIFRQKFDERWGRLSINEYEMGYAYQKMVMRWGRRDTPVKHHYLTKWCEIPHRWGRVRKLTLWPFHFLNLTPKNVAYKRWNST